MSRPAAPQAAWLIELQSNGVFRGWLSDDDDVDFGWTSDPNRAIKFASKADADMARRRWNFLMDRHSTRHLSTEHIWLDAPAAPRSEPVCTVCSESISVRCDSALCPQNSFSTAPQGTQQEQHDDDESNGGRARGVAGEGDERSRSTGATDEAIGSDRSGEHGAGLLHPQRDADRGSGRNAPRILIDNDTLRKQLAGDPDDEPSAGNVLEPRGDAQEAKRLATWARKSAKWHADRAEVKRVRGGDEEGRKAYQGEADMLYAVALMIRAQAREIAALTAERDAIRRDMAGFNEAIATARRQREEQRNRAERAESDLAATTEQLRAAEGALLDIRDSTYRNATTLRAMAGRAHAAMAEGQR